LGGGGGGAGSDIGMIKACIINGICEEWENANMCPSDCGTTTTITTTTIPTGETTTTTTLPTTTTITLPTTTTTQPSSGIPTGMFAAFTGNLSLLMLILVLIAIVLGVIKFKILPITLSKTKGSTQD
jgi:hypothetical protein